jgi:hypothetical protein
VRVSVSSRKKITSNAINTVSINDKDLQKNKAVAAGALQNAAVSEELVGVTVSSRKIASKAIKNNSISVKDLQKNKAVASDVPQTNVAVFKELGGADALSRKKIASKAINTVSISDKVTNAEYGIEAATGLERGCAHGIYFLDQSYYEISIAQELDYALKGSSECAICNTEFGRGSKQIKPTKNRPIYACMQMRKASCSHAVCSQCFSAEVLKVTSNTTNGMKRKRKAKSFD